MSSVESFFAGEIRRFRRVFPRQRISPGRGHAVDDGGGAAEKANWWKENDVVLGVEVVDLAIACVLM